MGIKLTLDNYYTPDANRDYMSVSQFKAFAGTTVHPACEMAAYKDLINPHGKAWTTSLLVGSYVDAYFEGTLDEFRAENRSLICTKASIKKFEEGKGGLELLSDYKKAEALISRLSEDRLFMSYCSGQRQVIMTAIIFGIEWKIKMDFFFPGEKITDLKIIRDMKPVWCPSIGAKADFIHYWGYDIQGAIYQKVVELNTGRKLPFYICAGTKEDIPDLEVIEITQPHLDAALDFVESRLPHVMDVKNGIVAPSRCNTCASCRTSKTLTGPITIDSIMPVPYGREPDDVPDEHRTPASLWD